VNTATTTATRPRTAADRAPAPWLQRVLWLDTAVGLVSGLAVTALAAPLSTQLDAAIPVVVVLGLLFVAAGVVNGWAARSGGRLPTLLAIDLDLVGAAIATGLLLLASPTGFGTGLLVLTAVWTAVIAAIKLTGLRSGRD
jgi:hypothetical protein